MGMIGDDWQPQDAGVRGLGDFDGGQLESFRRFPPGTVIVRFGCDCGRAHRYHVLGWGTGCVRVSRRSPFVNYRRAFRDSITVALDILENDQIFIFRGRRLS
jgi:hypothetical protein